MFTQPLHHKQDLTRGQFLSEVKQVWIQSFPSRLVAISMFKSSVHPTIYS